MTRTPSTAITIPTVDVRIVRAEENKRVTQALGVLDPPELLSAAAEMARQAEKTLREQLLPRREKLALSLACYAHVRGLHTAAYLSRPGLGSKRRAVLGLTAGEKLPARDKIRGLAKARGVKEIPLARAVRELPEVVAAIVVAEERRTIAVMFRQIAALALHDHHDWSDAEIAQAAGMHASRVREDFVAARRRRSGP